jgi:hypothetical protein
MNDASLQTVFRTIVVSRLTYASPAWRGFITASDFQRVDAFLRRCKRSGYCSSDLPDEYGESKFVIMFGGLHIEMAALKALGSLLTGSGWVEAISGADLISAGSAEGLLSACRLTRQHQFHETGMSFYDAMTIRRLCFLS